MTEEQSLYYISGILSTILDFNETTINTNKLNIHFDDYSIVLKFDADFLTNFTAKKSSR